MKNFVFLSFFGFFFAGMVQAAKPMVHILVAQKYLLKKDSQRDRKTIFYATLFPDIRHLGTVARTATHFKNTTLQDIKDEKSDFMAGMKLHSWVDETREKFAVESGIYQLVKKYESEKNATFLKMVEDEILWNDSIAKEMVENVFSFPYQQATFKVPEEAFKKWNSILWVYFSSKPSITMKTLVNNKQGFLDISPDKVVKWSQFLNDETNLQPFKNYTHSLMEHFDKMLDENKHS